MSAGKRPKYTTRAGRPRTISRRDHRTGPAGLTLVGCLGGPRKSSQYRDRETCGTIPAMPAAVKPGTPQPPREIGETTRKRCHSPPPFSTVWHCAQLLQRDIRPESAQER